MSTDKIIKDSTHYTLATLCAQVLGVITSILIRRYINPEMMGIWASLTLILSYASFAHLGLFTAAEVKIPFLKGKDQLHKADTIRFITFSFCFTVSVCILAGLFSVSFLMSSWWQPSVILGIRMMALIVVATLFYNLYVGFLRADKHFSVISWSMLLSAAVMLVFGLPLVYRFKLEGLYAATLISTLAGLGLIILLKNYSLKFLFDLKETVDLAKIGLPLIIAGIIYTFLLSIDKIMIIKYLGMKDLGYYSIAILALTYTNVFPKIVGIVITPDIQEAFGKTESPSHIMKYVTKPALLLAYVFPALLAAAYFIIPLLVHYIMPKYVPGIVCMKILLAGCFFISLVPLAQNFIIALNKQLLLVPMTLLAVAIGIAANYTMVKLNYGIEGIAVGTSLAYTAYFFIGFIYVLRHSGRENSAALFLGKVSFPCVYAAAVIFLLERHVHMSGLLMRSLVQAAIFYLLYSPLLFHVEKKYKIFSALRKVVSRPKAKVTEFPQGGYNP